MLKRVWLFLGVGSIGFVADVGAMIILTPGLGVYFARSLAFLVAVAVTFVLNRRITFADRQVKVNPRQSIYYVIASLISGTANLSVYYLFIFLFGDSPLSTMLAFCIGVAIGMVANFLQYNFLVFQRRTGTNYPNP